MKKTLIAVAAAAALATSSAFAEITFRTEANVIFAPVASNGDDIVSGIASPWNRDGSTRLGRLNISGHTEDNLAGFEMSIYKKANRNAWDLDFEKNGDDAAFVWIRPIEQLKISIGKFDDWQGGLRDYFDFVSWGWLRPGNWIYGATAFTTDSTNRCGFLLELDPIENLHFMLKLPVKTGLDSMTVERLWRTAQIGAKYKFEGLGEIRAQWIGDWHYTKDDDGDPDEDAIQGIINVAFDFTAVENLLVTVGARFGIADIDSSKKVVSAYDDENPWDYADSFVKMSFTAGVQYKATEDLTLSLNGTFYQSQNDAFGKADDLTDICWDIGGGVTYKIMDGLTAMGEVRYATAAPKTWSQENDNRCSGYGEDGDDGALSFLVGINKNIGNNAGLGIAFQGATNGCGLNGLQPDAKDDFVWAVPVRVTFAF